MDSNFEELLTKSLDIEYKFVIDDLLKFSLIDGVYYKAIGEVDNYYTILYHVGCLLESGQLDEEFFSDHVLNTKKFELCVSRLDNHITQNKDKNFSLEIQELPMDEYNRIVDEVKSTLYLFSQFVPHVDYKSKITREEYKKLSHASKSKQYNNSRNLKQKLRAIHDFCPELIKRLQKQDTETKKRVLHLITGANQDDCYKYSFTSQSRLLSEIEIDYQDELDKVNKE